MEPPPQAFQMFLPKPITVSGAARPVIAVAVSFHSKNHPARLTGMRQGKVDAIVRRARDRRR